MIFPEEATDRIITAPKAHQRIISKLTTGLGALYYHQQKIHLEPLPETMIDEGQTSPVPDVLLYDNQYHRTPVIVEVCHTSGIRNDIRKIIRLVDEFDYGIEEGFLYDYVAGQWQRYTKGDTEMEVGVSYSRQLGLDLDRFL